MYLRQSRYETLTGSGTSEVPANLFMGFISCERAITNLGAAVLVVVDAGIEVLDLALAEEAGTASIVDASEAFNDYAKAAALVRDLANFVIDELDLPDADVKSREMSDICRGTCRTDICRGTCRTGHEQGPMVLGRPLGFPVGW